MQESILAAEPPQWQWKMLSGNTQRFAQTPIGVGARTVGKTTRSESVVVSVTIVRQGVHNKQKALVWFCCQCECSSANSSSG